MFSDGAAGIFVLLSALVLARIPYPAALALILLRLVRSETMPPLSSDAASERSVRIYRLCTQSLLAYLFELQARHSHLKTRRMKARTAPVPVPVVGLPSAPPPSPPSAEDAMKKERLLPAEQTLAISRVSTIARMARATLASDWGRATPEQRLTAIQRADMADLIWAPCLIFWVFVQNSSVAPLFSDSLRLQDCMYQASMCSVLTQALSAMYLLWRGWLRTQQRASMQLLALNDAFMSMLWLADWLQHFVYCFDLLGLSNLSSPSQRVGLVPAEDMFCTGKSYQAKWQTMPFFLWTHGVNLRRRLQLGAVLLALSFACTGELKEGIIESTSGMSLLGGNVSEVFLLSTIVGQALIALIEANSNGRTL